MTHIYLWKSMLRYTLLGTKFLIFWHRKSCCISRTIIANLKIYYISTFSDSLQEIVTALYCKLLIILGLAFPMAEQISPAVSIGTYQLFYVYLYLGSLLFLVFVYIDLCRTKASNVVSKTDMGLSVKRASAINNLDTSTSPTNHQINQLKNSSVSTHSKTTGQDNITEHSSIVQKIPVIPRPRVHYGSFYLRVGCVG